MPKRSAEAAWKYLTQKALIHNSKIINNHVLKSNITPRIIVRHRTNYIYKALFCRSFSTAQDELLSRPLKRKEARGQMKTDMAQDDVGRSINILSGKIKREIDRTFADTELTGVQSKILHYIYFASEKGDVFQKDISEKFCLNRSSAAETLNFIEKAGMILRESVDHDARQKKIVLTEKAMELKQKLCENISYTEGKLIEGISKEELKTFMVVISKMQDNIDSIHNNAKNQDKC